MTVMHSAYPCKLRVPWRKDGWFFVEQLYDLFGKVFLLDDEAIDVLVEP